MKINQAANERNRSLFINITVVVVSIGLIVSFIVYLKNGSTNIKRIALENLAEQFSSSVSNAHWQWQSEGRPHTIMLVTYANRLDENSTLVESQRKPILMSRLGWPKAEPTSQGCTDIWEMVLNIPMDIDGFEVVPKYYEDVKQPSNSLNFVCRYQLSTGPYFEYKVFSGQVLSVIQ